MFVCLDSLVTFGRFFEPGHNLMVEYEKHIFLCKKVRGFQKKLESSLKISDNALNWLIKLPSIIQP